MSWTTMHFAVGMICGGGIASGVAGVRGRGWRWVPAAMTLGGIWANIPDMPRFWRVDFPWLPGSFLGSLDFEHFLHRFGDIFFFHHTMDLHFKGNALPGLFLILILYNLVIGALVFAQWTAQRNEEITLRVLEKHLRALRAQQVRGEQENIENTAEKLVENPDLPVVIPMEPIKKSAA